MRTNARKLVETNCRQNAIHVKAMPANWWENAGILMEADAV